MINQILVADESGDGGISDKPGTSRYFTVGIVFFDDLDEAKNCSKRIEELKIELSVKEEFKFAKLPGVKRIAFLKDISNFNFYYFGVIIDKQKIIKQGVYTEESFYKYACGLAFTLALPYIDNALVVIDGSGSRQFKHEFKQYLQKRMEQKIKKFKLEDSKKNNLIQLADMVVGSIARSVTDKEDKNRYLKIINHKELELKHYPHL